MDITCTLKNIHIWVGVGIHEIGWLDGLKEKVTFEERYEKGKRGLDLCLHRLVWILEGYSLSRLKRCGDVVMWCHRQMSLKVRDLDYHPVMQPIKIRFPSLLR